MKNLFDLILYVPVNNFSVMSGWVFLGGTSSKRGLMCLAQGHNTVILVRLEPATRRSQVKHSTTEPLHSLVVYKGEGLVCVLSCLKTCHRFFPVEAAIKSVPNQYALVQILRKVSLWDDSNSIR